MFAKNGSLLDGWLERHGAAVGIVLTVLAFVGTVELVVRVVSVTAHLI
jgi:hypothetical protein